VNISLMMVQQDGTAKELPLRSLPATIGRGQECKLRIPLASVSRHHCELLEDDDELVVRDLKSSNGTYVNKERVARRELVPGDLLAVGPVVFVVRIDGHPKDIDAAAAYAAGSVAPPPGGPPSAIDGVPTWSGQQAGGGGGGGGGAQPAPKPDRKDDELSQIDSLLDELGESDFDLDLDDKPKR
jgi:hypothetical protein